MTNHRTSLSVSEQPADFVLLEFADMKIHSEKYHQSYNSSCSSISFTDATSCCHTEFDASFNDTGNIKVVTAPLKKHQIQNQGARGSKSNFAKRKKAILRRSSSFDDDKPRPSKTRPRRHRSTGSDQDQAQVELQVEQEVEEENCQQDTRWETPCPSIDQAPRINTNSNHSASRWDSGTDSGHSRRSSFSIAPPSRHDSFSDLADIFALPDSDDDATPLTPFVTA
jgi:hypothetical protein